MKLGRLFCTVNSAFCVHSLISGRNSDSQTNSVQWGPCDAFIVSSRSCAFFDVPLDYHDSSAGNGRLALIKVNATRERRGTVFMNPGGPGASGVELFDVFSAAFLDWTGGFYDVVSWDPRGSGSLTIPGNTHCFDSGEEEQAFFAGTTETHGIEELDNFTDPQDIQSLLAQAPLMQQKYEELGKRCLEHPSGKYMPYLGTPATVRDLVAMADALDGPGSPVNFFGLSYGTVIGTFLVNMFPERVGHIVLDGVVDPLAHSHSDPALAWPQRELVDADQVYNGFVTGCALAGPDACPLASSAESPSPLDVHEKVQGLLAAAHDAFRANSSVPISSGQLRLVFRDLILSPLNWQSFANSTLPLIIEQVHAEAQGNTTGHVSDVLTRALQKQKRQQRAAFQNSYSNQTTLCGDGGESTTNMTGIYEGIIATSQNISHMFGPVWPYSPYYCPFWPVRPVERYVGPFNRTLANSILVIGNTYDPATSFSGAKAVADELGDSATLVRLNGFGHVSLSAGSSACLSNIIRAYMANRTLPEGDDTVCEVDGDYEIFPGVNTSRILFNLLPEGVF
ncbi:alpha/beta-hydrolase [Fomes fomentarius]|nr:alpha/beta-hydrolase [Fomes fomentarius]